MTLKGRAYFLDNAKNDVDRVSRELSLDNPQLAHELLMDYKQGILDEAGGLLFNAQRTGPKYTNAGVIKKGSDRITFSRNTFDDLSLEDQIRVLKDNIDGYDALIKSTGLSDAELQAKLKPHNPNELIYQDLIDILAESGDSKTAIYSGPGQVGSPGRDGGKQFTRPEALKNAAQYLSEPSTDRLLGTHVSFPQQGHVLDAKNNKALARDINNMRAQQGEPNRRDGADARGLVNLTRSENLSIGRNNDVQKLLELIDERLNGNITQTEAKNLIDMAREIQGQKRGRHAGDVLSLLGRMQSPDQVSTSDQGKAVNIFANDVYLGKAINGNGNGKGNGKRNDYYGY